MKTCIKCNSINDDKVAFCENCGNSFSTNQSDINWESKQPKKVSIPAKKKWKILFKWSFWGYFFKSLWLMILTVFTFWLLFPYFAYWNMKYFFSNLEIEMED